MGKGFVGGNSADLFRLSELPQILFQPPYLPEFGFVKICEGDLKEG